VLEWWSAPFDMKLGQLGTPAVGVVVAIALSHPFFVGGSGFDEADAAIGPAGPAGERAR